MKNVLIIALLLIGASISVQAQNFDVPPNPEAGKCYERCFDYDKKIEWKEIDCSKVKEQNIKMTAAQLAKFEEKKQKMEQYQEKLKALGYNVEVTGIADNKTIIAHHKYLQQRKKKK
ncbi:hypothetical protein [uncultured Kordia sp.]|uniref:hypothetical protein n=1 Tax=uncultured Kordia sp. TaxID=507699 RepID=UPI002602D06A|nr:hypothetical protein [uncultured Kordia sp.]